MTEAQRLGLSTSKPNAGSNLLDLRMIYGRPSVNG
jgi:hypothetical protein